MIYQYHSSTLSTPRSKNHIIDVGLQVPWHHNSSSNQTWKHSPVCCRSKCGHYCSIFHQENNKIGPYNFNKELHDDTTIYLHYDEQLQQAQNQSKNNFPLPPSKHQPAAIYKLWWSKQKKQNNQHGQHYFFWEALSKPQTLSLSCSYILQAATQEGTQEGTQAATKAATQAPNDSPTRWRNSINQQDQSSDPTATSTSTAVKPAVSPVASPAAANYKKYRSCYNANDQTINVSTNKQS